LHGSLIISRSPLTRWSSASVPLPPVCSAVASPCATQSKPSSARPLLPQVSARTGSNDAIVAASAILRSDTLRRIWAIPSTLRPAAHMAQRCKKAATVEGTAISCSLAIESNSSARSATIRVSPSTRLCKPSMNRAKATEKGSERRRVAVSNSWVRLSPANG
jgi:hypothetical protein